MLASTYFVPIAGLPNTAGSIGTFVFTSLS
jgi:hypothetical protein